MSRLIEFREMERMLQLKLERLETLKKKPALQQELAFKDKFQALMRTYDKSLSDVVALLAPMPAIGKNAGARRKAKGKLQSR